MSMKKRLNLFFAGLLFLSIIMGAMVVVSVLNRDTVPPAFSYDSEVVMPTEKQLEKLNEGELDLLLEGVHAQDDVDGDLTDKMVIHDVDVQYGGLYAIITYHVSDSSNNLGIGHRIVYIKSPEEIHRLIVAQITGESPEEEPERVGEPPVFTMQSQVNLPVGTAFNPGDFLIELSDDKDTPEELGARAVMEGSFDIYTPGDYQLTFYTVDSDGNQSVPSVLTLTIGG